MLPILVSVRYPEGNFPFPFGYFNFSLFLLSSTNRYVKNLSQLK